MLIVHGDPQTADLVALCQMSVKVDIEREQSGASDGWLGICDSYGEQFVQDVADELDAVCRSLLHGWPGAEKLGSGLDSTHADCWTVVIEVVDDDIRDELSQRLASKVKSVERV